MTATQIHQVIMDPSVVGTRRFGMVNLVIKRNATNPLYQVDIDADYLEIQEFNASDINLTVDMTVSGKNGLDTGSEASSTNYAIWVIYNPTTKDLGGLLSASMTSPTLPSGYTKKRRVGFLWNNASSNIDGFRILNDEFRWNKDITQAAERSFDGAPTTGSFQDHALATGLVPSIEMEVYLAANATTGGGGGGGVAIRPKEEEGDTYDWGNTDFNDITVDNAEGASQDMSNRVWVRQNSSRQIQYRTGTQVSNLIIMVLGFRIPPL